MYKVKVSDFGNKIIFDVANQFWIPMDESNTDYQAYLAWLAEGNTPEEWTGK